MPNLTLDLADGRTVRLENAPVPEEGPLPASVQDEIVGAHIEGVAGEVIKLDRGADFVVFDRQNPQNILVIEIKQDARKVRPGIFSDQNIRRNLDKWLTSQRVDKDHLRIRKELWQPDLAARALWIYSLDEAGVPVEGPRYYRIETVTKQNESDDFLAAFERSQQNELDTPHIERRVADWQRRILQLYENIQLWLLNISNGEYQCDTTRSVLMNEELMQKFAVPSRNLPVLYITKSGSVILTFKPYALWIIGGNGRVDVVGRKGAFLVDRARAFEPANWELYFTGERVTAGARIRQSSAFNSRTLSALLAEA